MMVQRQVRAGSAYSEEFEVKVGVHQESALSPLLFAIVDDVITENARRGVVNELLYGNRVPTVMENFGKKTFLESHRKFVKN